MYVARTSWLEIIYVIIAKNVLKLADVQIETITILRHTETFRNNDMLDKIRGGNYIFLFCWLCKNRYNSYNHMLLLCWACDIYIKTLSLAYSVALTV